VAGAVSVGGVSGSVGAYVAQVDRALGSGQALYPASMGPVGVASSRVVYESDLISGTGVS
jgi:hypothetical protein